MNEDEKCDLVKEMAEYTNIKVKTYEIDPIVFIMGFDDSLFAEQYHFGRPNHLVNPNSCIGKHVPMIQYRRKSNGYEFYKSHFDYMWSIGTDSTLETIGKALCNHNESMFPKEEIIY